MELIYPNISENSDLFIVGHYYTSLLTTDFNKAVESEHLIVVLVRADSTHFVT